jgi:hypothetical protein
MHHGDDVQPLSVYLVEVSTRSSSDLDPLRFCIREEKRSGLFFGAS